MNNKGDVIKTLKLAREFLYEEFSVTKIAIFGSVAKDLNSEKSDIDILVELEKPIGFKFNQLVEFLEKILDCRVDVLTMEGVKNIRIKSIANDIEKSLIYV